MEYNVILDFKRAEILQTDIVFSQGDYGRAKLNISCRDNDVPITDAESAEISFATPNGYLVTGSLEGSDGEYSYIFEGNEFQAAGIVISAVTLKWPDGRLSSCLFAFKCRQIPQMKPVDAGNYISELDKVIEDANEKIIELQELIDQLTPEIGSTALVKADLYNGFDYTQVGLKAADAVALATLSKSVYIQPLTDINNPPDTGVYATTSATQGDFPGTNKEGIVFVTKNDTKFLEQFYDSATKQMSVRYKTDVWGRWECSAYDYIPVSVPAQSSAEDITNAFNSYSQNLPDGTKYNFRMGFGVVYPPFGNLGGVWTVEGYKHDQDFEWQTAKSYISPQYAFKRNKKSGVWSDWDSVVTKSQTSSLHGNIIPSSRNANDCNSFGGYYLSDISAISNLPNGISGSAFMMVFGEFYGSGGRFCQLLCSDQGIYIRKFTGSYQQWIKV